MRDSRFIRNLFLLLTIFVTGCSGGGSDAPAETTSPITIANPIGGN